MKLKPILLLPLFFMMGLLLTHCSSSQKTDSTSKDKVALASNLTRGEAEIRARDVTDTRYDLKFDFENMAPAYTATADIYFKMTTPQSTFLDFRGAEIINFSINDQTKNADYQNNRVQLTQKDLRAGENHVRISYKQTFSKNGRGIYRFQDPVDNKVYVWTKLEPFDANHVFPCFDQPDMKSTITAQISAPTDWKVVFTTLESKKENTAGKTLWTFPASPIMSTYLFSIHAGHYEVWHDKYKQIPLRLFTRASLKKYFEAPLWFSITKKGFQHFEKEFGYPYPFKKYDQLVVPDFSSGGMENIAAVNYHERHIMRGASSREEKENLANILLHEMAHMWFGDLVTMKWWDELWLNESFATYMAFDASEKATEYKDAWMSFQRRGKLTAYIEDQYPTTHPVSTDVPDINATFNHFDAITYSKGASTLRQLAYYIGEDKFRKGVQQYFKDHAYKNTTLPQFIGALEKASGKNLRLWSVSWLKNAGLDTIKVAHECEQSTLSRVKFELIPPTAKDQVRPHRINFDAYNVNGDKISRRSLEDWTSTGSSETRTFTPAQGFKCPDFIMPNPTDVAYIKLFMDGTNARWFQEHLHKIPSAQARGIIWNQAYLNLRDGNIKIDDFIKMFMSQYEKENNSTVTQQFFTYWSAIATYLPAKTDIQIAVRNKILETIENYFWVQLEKSKDAGWKKTLLNNWARRVELPTSQKKLVDLIDGTRHLKPLPIDQDLRWILIQRLSTLGHPQADVLLAKEKDQDTSENGFKQYISAQASKPSMTDKSKWLEEMNRPDSNWSLARKQSVMNSLFPNTPQQTQLRSEFRSQFYKTMSALNKKNEDVSYNRSYAGLAPSNCDDDSINEFDHYIDSNDWHVVTKKVLVIQNQENKICARICPR